MFSSKLNKNLIYEIFYDEKVGFYKQKKNIYKKNIELNLKLNSHKNKIDSIRIAFNLTDNKTFSTLTKEQSKALELRLNNDDDSSKSDSWSGKCYDALEKDDDYY